MPDPLRGALRRRRARQVEEQLATGRLWRGADRGPVFANEVGEPLSGIQVERHFQRLLVDTGLLRMCFHDLRHRAATVLLALGVDLRTIMETLGHSQIGVTMDLYTGVTPELKRDAAPRVEATLWETGLSEGARTRVAVKIAVNTEQISTRKEVDRKV